MADTTADDSAFNFIAKLDVLNLCGDEARRWLVAFRGEQNFLLANRVFKAMVLFRRHEAENALGLLDTVAAELHQKADEIPSIIHILRRWHFSAMAYYHYLNDDLPAARKALQDARDEVCNALTLHPFLIPIATHCIDFRIQLARIARRENRWVEVKRHIDRVRDIYADRRPFCVLHSGQPVRLSDLRAFYLSLPLDEKQKEDAGFALDESYDHSEWIDRLEENIFALPDFVIPYS
jgi:hypothetical protein